MKAAITEMLNSFFSTVDRNKYNSAMGFFQKYSDAESDELGVRFADVKLQNKDDDGNDISATVPLLQIGSKNSIIDFRLEEGDEILILFTDRTLEQWKDTTGITPQSLKNKVKDSINHGIGIPVCSHHNSAKITTTALDSTVGLRLGVKAGKKVQLGTDVDDLVNICYNFINIFDTVIAATPADGDALNSALIAQSSNITTLKTKLANITKI
jgi:hypothetical protein